ncbi:hypothetical protein [Leifsonia sp. AG29]|uniref:hypothetical protein n=1 Tax=Leifsonia sp. AG29 TaxID=2598860 RepID=UPI001E62DDEE|nr:hypothetical protein [Leifsonia sp. AG29]
MRNRTTFSMRGAAAALAGLALVLGSTLPAQAASLSAPAAAAPVPAELTNLSHLDFLLDDVPLLSGVPGHTTYRAAQEPTARAPWVYADRQPDGSFHRVGGGPVTDPARGWYAQGAYDADDISRAAVVYLRDWKQNGTASSRTNAYELLRSLTYLQTADGPNAGNVVLWQQHDGTLNPSAIPKELPDPSDSAESFWLARTVWALGEGYAGFRSADPAFASFLADRMHLAVATLQRQSLSKYGQTAIANGVSVPAWLIVGSAGATAEAVLGLSAYANAAPGDDAVKTALARYSEGIADLSSGGVGQWPFGALLPEANSPTFWHAWAGMQPAALTAAASTLHDSSLQQKATADLAVFTAQLLASGGPDNGWTPTPADRTQIAYGVDSRLEGLIAASDATGAGGLAALAGAQAAWYFGANRAGVAAYDPSTGVCIDGIAGDGTVNHNCGAESTIHTELSMLALDAHPAIARAATSLTRTVAADGLTVAEAETGTLAGPAIVRTPASAWTGSANWSGGAYVEAQTGSTVTIALPAGHPDVRILPIADLGPAGDGTVAGSGTTTWTAAVGGREVPLGSTDNARNAPQGIAPTPVLLLPQTLSAIVPAGATSVTARVSGTVSLDAVIVQPVVSHLALAGTASLDLYVNSTDQTAKQKLRAAGPVTVTSYDSSGRQTGPARTAGAGAEIRIQPGGFATVVPR